MSLSINTLAQALQDLGDPSSPRYPGDGSLAQAAERLTRAYDAYASQAVDLGGNRLAAGNTAAMQVALTVTFASSINTVAGAAQAFGAAHTAYWAGAVFTPGAPPPPGTPGIAGGNGIFSLVASSVVSVAPGAALTAGLLAIFAAPSTHAADRSQELAKLWDRVSKMVTVLMVGIDATPSPAGPLPISATGFVR